MTNSAESAVGPGTLKFYFKGCNALTSFSFAFNIYSVLPHSKGITSISWTLFRNAKAGWRNAGILNAMLVVPLSFLCLCYCYSI